MDSDIKLVAVISAVIIAAFSIAYLYFSADIFVNVLRKPLRLISWGMYCLDFGVLLVTIVSYEAANGHYLSLAGIQLGVFFYLFYVVGSVLIILGAREFKHSPKP